MTKFTDLLNGSCNEFIEQTPFLSALLERTATLKSVNVFVAQYWAVSQDFPSLLLTLASRTADMNVRYALLANLWDEHGAGTPEVDHRRLLDNFCRSAERAGWIACTTTASSPSTNAYRASLRGVFSHSPSAEAIGLLAFLEAITPIQYNAVLRWISSLSDGPKLDTRFWSEHVAHDGTHAGDLLQLAAGWNESEFAQAVVGVHTGRELERLFWSQFDPHL